jgi:3-oxoadipate enol-lactonase
MVGMWLAAHAPERVDRLALLCTSAWLGPAQPWRERADKVRASGTEVVADAVVARWFTPGFAVAQPRLVAEHRAMLTSTPARGYAACCEAIAAMDLRADLSSIKAPTLVIVGADDPAIPDEHAELIVDRIAGARLCVVPDAAHLANVEQPDRITRLLLDHFGEQS